MRQKQQKYDNHTKGKNKQASKQASKKKKNRQQKQSMKEANIYMYNPQLKYIYVQK